MQIYTGCSGWSYPEWRGEFYPPELLQGKWFDFYAQRFNSVEVNNTFYRFPTEALLMRWKEQTPQNFRLSLKANRAITHFNKFHQTESLLTDFYQRADALEDKLGYILFQLPKQVKYNPELLNIIVKQLSSEKMNAIEFRDKSWWRDEVIETLLKKNIIFVNVNAPNLHFPFIDTGKTCYFRFHGFSRWYKGHYEKAFLESYISAIKASKAKSVWCYFDNTMDISAPADALLWNHLFSHF